MKGVAMTISTAPKDEPKGYRSAPGYVKTHPENNDHYVEQFKDHPWYHAILRAHEDLTQAVPGYNIVQIKEKFNGLRYYYQLPDELDTDEYRARADRIIAFAEGWCAGFEYYSYTEEEEE